MSFEREPETDLEKAIVEFQKAELEYINKNYGRAWVRVRRGRAYLWRATDSDNIYRVARYAEEQWKNERVSELI